MNKNDASGQAPAAYEDYEDEGPQVGLAELLTWIGEGKRLIVGVTLLVALVATGYSLWVLPVMFTARTTLLPPGSQQQSGSAAALAALGSLGGLAGGLGAKTPDELYVALLRSDSVQRALAEQFNLQQRYKAVNYEQLRARLPGYIRVTADKKSGLITVEVDDEDPKFAANLANAHAGEITKVLGRLAVSEAQSRRAFFEQQLNETKEHLVKAELGLRSVQEKSGVIVLDKQAEALIGGAATLRAQIAEREVQMKVLRTSATEQNPDVLRLSSELRGLRAELARMESSKGGDGSAVDIPVGRLPEAAIDYVRARREVKLQETLLETMIRQFEVAKLDEAKEGPVLQQVDMALPPDYKSKPKRAIIVLASALLALLASTVWVVVRRYMALLRDGDAEAASAWNAASRAWSFRR
ncbi:MAG: Wzz/FepE/Etk N-terminal domain-containing protein [Rhizobacter sp.]|nr:Wzz/FepE/Etk N-terminal domain-containing protein [Rhizobacter sp.]